MYTDRIYNTRESMACADKRKYEVLMLDAKQQIIKRMQKGEKPLSLIAKFKGRRVTISDIKKNMQQILAYIFTMETFSGTKNVTL